jgi:hypothetical protein
MTAAQVAAKRVTAVPEAPALVSAALATASRWMSAREVPTQMVAQAVLSVCSSSVRANAAARVVTDLVLAAGWDVGSDGDTTAEDRGRLGAEVMAPVHPFSAR